LVFLAVDVEIVNPNRTTGARALRASAHGIPRDAVMDRLLREVKAATYCGASVERVSPAGLRAKCVVDL
jgi:SHS2 domain-containing protein